MAEDRDPATNLLKVTQTEEDLQVPYAVNEFNQDYYAQSKPSKCKKLRCLSCRECTCCIVGSFISLILCVTGLVFFIVAGSKSVSTEPLGQPANVKFINQTIGSDFIYLKWKPPTKTGGAYITSYTLQYKYTNDTLTSSNWTNVLMIDEGLGNNHNVTNLNGSYQYQFRITANNLAGYTGNWTYVSSTTKPAKVPQAPSAPFALNIESTKDGNYQFTMAFTANSNGGSTVTEYTIFYGLYANNTEFSKFCSINTTILSQLNQYQYPNCSGTMTKSDLSQLYDFKVTATNSIGNSSYSASTPCIIPIDNPEYYMCLEIGPPATLTSNAFTLDVSSYEADISWNEESCTDSTPVLKYQLQRTDFWENTDYENVSLAYDGLSQFVQINNLLAGLPYNLRLRSFNKYGASDWSYLMIQTPENGKCGNEYDTKILRDNCKQFAQASPAIYVKCNGDDNCQTSDFENEWHFSANCTSCWVQLNDCAMGICVKQCLKDFNTQNCQTCIQDQCSPETEICTGYPNWPIACP